VRKSYPSNIYLRSAVRQQPSISICSRSLLPKFLPRTSQPEVGAMENLDMKFQEVGPGNGLPHFPGVDAEPTWNESPPSIPNTKISTPYAKLSAAVSTTSSG